MENTHKLGSMPPTKSVIKSLDRNKDNALHRSNVSAYHYNIVYAELSEQEYLLNTSYWQTAAEVDIEMQEA